MKLAAYYFRAVLLCALVIVEVPSLRAEGNSKGVWLGIFINNGQDGAGDKVVRVVAVHKLGPSASYLFPGTFIKSVNGKAVQETFEVPAALAGVPEGQKWVSLTGVLPSGDAFSARIPKMVKPVTFKGTASCPDGMKDAPSQIEFRALESRGGVDAIDAEKSYVTATTGCTLSGELEAELRQVVARAKAKQITFEAALVEAVSPRPKDTRQPKLKAAPDKEFQYVRAIQAIAYYQFVFVNVKIEPGTVSAADLEQIRKDILPYSAQLNSVNPLAVDALKQISEIEARHAPVQDRLRRLGIAREQLVEHYRKEMVKIFHPAKEWSPEFLVSALGFEVAIRTDGLTKTMEKFAISHSLIGPSYAYLIKHDEKYRSKNSRR